MKKTRIILLVIITILLGISNVYAANSSVVIGGQEEEIVKPGETKKIAVKLIGIEEKIGVMSGKIKTEGNITIEKVTAKKGWSLIYNNNDGEDKGLFNIYNPNGSKEAEIMEIEYTVGNEAGTAKIIIEETKVGDISYNEEALGDITKTITVINDEDEKEIPVKRTVIVLISVIILTIVAIVAIVVYIVNKKIKRY